MTASFFKSCNSIIRSFVGAPSNMAPPADGMDVDQPEKTGLFADLFFVVVPSDSLPESKALEVCACVPR
jgi:hypothetical protein